MSNNFISPHNLPLISDYLTRRETSIASLIGELSLSDLATTSDVEREKVRIEKEILLTPVELGEIEFIACETLKSGSLQKENETAKVNNQFTHRLSIPFIGDKVLFTCSPVGGVSKSPKPVVIIPIKNTIIINIALNEYNPQLAIHSAMEQMGETLDLLEKNNSTAIEWNKKAKQQISELLRAKFDQISNSSNAKTYTMDSKKNPFQKREA
ncbi:MAG: hypothetical protein ACOYOT_02770 [Bacteroidales bacterium]